MTDVALWLAQVCVAATMLWFGIPKLGGSSSRALKLVGAVEVLGAIGVTVPWATRILPWLTPLAAAGLAALMLGAAVDNIRKRSMRLLAVTATMLALTLAIAIGRAGA